MYEFEDRVRFSEINNDGKLTMMGVLNYFQDCCLFQSEDGGIGVEYFRDLHEAWVINYWQIDFFKMPKFGTKLKIGTIPYTLKSFLGFRNFYLDDAETKERYACANSIWTLINLDTARPVRPNEKMIEVYSVSEKLSMDYADRKKIMPVEEGDEREPVIVAKHHLDTNNHVNNGQYVQIALDYIPDNFTVRRLEAEYDKQAMLGDSIIPIVYAGPDFYTVSLNDKDGKTFARVKFSE